MLLYTVKTVASSSSNIFVCFFRDITWSLLTTSQLLRTSSHSCQAAFHDLQSIGPEWEHSLSLPTLSTRLLPRFDPPSNHHGRRCAGVSQAARPRVTMQQTPPREILVESMSGRPAPHRYRSTVPQRQDCMHDRESIIHLLVTWTFLRSVLNHGPRTSDWRAGESVKDTFFPWPAPDVMPRETTKSGLMTVEYHTTFASGLLDNV